MNSSAGRIRREQRTIDAMIRIYCSDHHCGDRIPCADCGALLDYARRRLEICPFQDAKPACNHCTVHCYSAKMKERVKAVMRYSGPRMLLRHPWLAILHLIDTRREAPDLPKRNRAKHNRRQDE